MGAFLCQNLPGCAELVVVFAAVIGFLMALW